MEDVTRQCPGCQRVLPLAAFRSPGRTGLGHKCWNCRGVRDPRWYATLSRADQNKDSYLRRSFGIGLDDYERMLRAQEGGCAACGAPPDERRLAIDHNQWTGVVRGLLCADCNIVLGIVQECREWLQALDLYLERAQGEAHVPLPYRSVRSRMKP